MNIMENKRVTAIALLMAVAFGGICHYAYGRYQALQEARSKIEQEHSKLTDYANEEFPPTPENNRVLKQASGTVEELAKDLRGSLVTYAKACAALGKDAKGNLIRPDVFQKEVNDMTAKVTAYAAQKNAKLSADAAALGLNEYKTASATERDAPYLNFILHSADILVRHVVDAGSPSIKRLYCAPLPEDKVGARKKPSLFPLEMEISFVARRSAQDIDTGKDETLSVLPRVINSLIADKNYFFIITGVSVRTEGNLPMLTPYKAPVAAAEDPMGGSGDAAPAAEPVAKLITGASTSEVDVSLTLQVLYFDTDKL